MATEYHNFPNPASESSDTGRSRTCPILPTALRKGVREKGGDCMGKSVRNELLSLLADVKEVSDSLECKYKTDTQPTAEMLAQLLTAYRLEMDLIVRLVDLR